MMPNRESRDEQERFIRGLAVELNRQYLTGDELSRLLSEVVKYGEAQWKLGEKAGLAYRKREEYILEQVCPACNSSNIRLVYNLMGDGKHWWVCNDCKSPWEFMGDHLEERED